MSATRKLMGYFLILCLVAFATYRGMRHHLQSQYSPQQTGLEWMRAEYQLSPETFETIKRLHEQYFADCEAMSMKISDANRHLLSGRGRITISEHTRRMLIQQDEELCAKFEVVTQKHLQNVAALLPATQAQRFLDDFSAGVHQQRMDHQRALSEKAQK